MAVKTVTRDLACGDGSLFNTNEPMNPRDEDETKSTTLWPVNTNVLLRDDLS